VEVTLLFIEDCPNWRRAEERLHTALALSGRADVVVRREPVGSIEEAERRGCRGSPSVLVDGRDPFADPDAPVGLACRLYRTPAGIDTAPAVDDLVAVLSHA
jgi:hypothetical protein